MVANLQSSRSTSAGSSQTKPAGSGNWVWIVCVCWAEWAMSVYMACSAQPTVRSVWSSTWSCCHRVQKWAGIFCLAIAAHRSAAALPKTAHSSTAVSCGYSSACACTFKTDLTKGWDNRNCWVSANQRSWSAFFEVSTCWLSTRAVKVSKTLWLSTQILHGICVAAAYINADKAPVISPRRLVWLLPGIPPWARGRKLWSSQMAIPHVATRNLLSGGWVQLPSVNKSKVCNGKVGWSTKKWAVVSGMESKHLSNKSKLDGLGNQPWARSAISPISGRCCNCGYLLRMSWKNSHSQCLCLALSGCAQ